MSEKERITESIQEFGKGAKCGHHGNLLNGKPCPDCFPEFYEQRQEPVSLKRIVTLLHEEAEKFEKQGMIQGKIGNTHDMHGKMDTARCFRVAANTLSGDQAG